MAKEKTPREHVMIINESTRKIYHSLYDFEKHANEETKSILCGNIDESIKKLQQFKSILN